MSKNYEEHRLSGEVMTMPGLCQRKGCRSKAAWLVVFSFIHRGEEKECSRLLCRRHRNRKRRKEGIR